MSYWLACLPASGFRLSSFSRFEPPGYGALMVSLVAVIVSYNRLDKLKTGLAATLEQRCDAVVVVNNCSTDGTGEWLDEQVRAHDHLAVVHAARNLGGAGGFELGFK